MKESVAAPDGQNDSSHSSYADRGGHAISSPATDATSLTSAKGLWRYLAALASDVSFLVFYDKLSWGTRNRTTCTTAFQLVGSVMSSETVVFQTR